MKPGVLMEAVILLNHFLNRPVSLMADLDLYSMLMLGLVGTGHCIGMCGPLVLALPTQVGGYCSHMLYHLGRITTYSVIGAVLGAVGSGFGGAASVSVAHQFPSLALVQTGFAIFAAALLLIFGLSRLALIGEPSWMSLASPTKIPGFPRILRSIMGNRSRLGMLPIGLLMGLLPCGLSYAAFAGALPSGGCLRGMLLTAVFGLGTVPGLLLIGTGASKFAQRYRRQSDIISGFLMIGMAVSIFVDAVLGSGCCTR
jgi:sulfite exporter TauE/SafE